MITLGSTSRRSLVAPASGSTSVGLRTPHRVTNGILSRISTVDGEQIIVFQRGGSKDRNQDSHNLSARSFFFKNAIELPAGYRSIGRQVTAPEVPRRDKLGGHCRVELSEEEFRTVAEEGRKIYVVTLVLANTHKYHPVVPGTSEN
jgi:hypothetical protein